MNSAYWKQRWAPLSITGAGTPMHLGDILETSGLHGVMSVSSISAYPTLGWTLTCHPRGQTQTDRQTERQSSGTCCYAHAAVAIQTPQWHPPCLLHSAQGTASRFLSLPQAAFIFHTTGNWTLSSVTKSRGCTASLSQYRKLNTAFSVTKRITLVRKCAVCKWNLPLIRFYSICFALKQSALKQTDIFSAYEN